MSQSERGKTLWRGDDSLYGGNVFQRALKSGDTQSEIMQGDLIALE